MSNNENIYEEINPIHFAHIITERKSGLITDQEIENFRYSIMHDLDLLKKTIQEMPLQDLSEKYRKMGNTFIYSYGITPIINLCTNNPKGDLFYEISWKKYKPDGSFSDIKGLPIGGMIYE